VVTGSSPVVAQTARRLPTSAIETKCEHNCLIGRAPHTAQESPPAQLLLRAAGPLSELSQPRFHGSGASGGKPHESVFLPRSLAGEASPQPDWLGHLLSQTCFRRRLEQPPPKMCPAFEGHPQGRLARPRFRETPPFRAASRTSPRREAHYAAPEVPSIDRPTPERVRARFARSSVTREWGSGEPAPFHSSRVPLP
jgi:hypothetical protein